MNNNRHLPSIALLPSPICGEIKKSLPRSLSIRLTPSTVSPAIGKFRVVLPSPEAQIDVNLYVYNRLRQPMDWNLIFGWVAQRVDSMTRAVNTSLDVAAAVPVLDTAKPLAPPRSASLDLYRIAYFRCDTDHDELFDTLLAKVCELKLELKALAETWMKTEPAEY